MQGSFLPSRCESPEPAQAHLWSCKPYSYYLSSELGLGISPQSVKPSSWRKTSHRGSHWPNSVSFRPFLNLFLEDMNKNFVQREGLSALCSMRPETPHGG